MYISKGNMKTGNIPTWSLPSKVTCPGSTIECRKHCYAAKAERMYKQVLPCRQTNLDATMENQFVDNVNTWLTKNKPSYFRIHESGDFYCQVYLNRWFEIANLNPGVKFLAFTKSFKLDYSNKPENLTIVFSVMPDSNTNTLPKGQYAYAGDCQYSKHDTLECPGNCQTCGMCWELPNLNKNVHFNYH
jgi:hypothetical protein